MKNRGPCSSYMLSLWIIIVIVTPSLTTTPVVFVEPSTDNFAGEGVISVNCSEPLEPRTFEIYSSSTSKGRHCHFHYEDFEDIDLQLPHRLVLSISTMNDTALEENPLSVLIVRPNYAGVFMTIPNQNSIMSSLSNTTEAEKRTWYTEARSFCFSPTDSDRNPLVMTNETFSLSNYVDVLFQTNSDVLINFTIQVFVEQVEEIELDGPDVNMTVTSSLRKFVHFRLPPDAHITNALLKVTAEKDDTCMKIQIWNPVCFGEYSSGEKLDRMFQVVKKEGRINVYSGFDKTGLGFLASIDINPRDPACNRISVDGSMAMETSDMITIELTRNDIHGTIWLVFFLLSLLYILLVLLNYLTFDKFYAGLHKEVSAMLTQQDVPHRSEANFVNVDDDQDMFLSDFKLTPANLLGVDKDGEKKKLFGISTLYLTIAMTVPYIIPIVLKTMDRAQKFLDTGDFELCHFNRFCPIPWKFFYGFNHVLSNIFYVIFGLAILSSCRRAQRRTKQNLEKWRNVPNGVNFLIGTWGYGHRIDLGMGWSLLFKGIVTAFYHVCPNRQDFEYHTSFNYILMLLIILKLYQLRRPITVKLDVSKIVAAVSIFCSGTVVLEWAWKKQDDWTLWGLPLVQSAFHIIVGDLMLTLALVTYCLKPIVEWVNGPSSPVSASSLPAWLQKLKDTYQEIHEKSFESACLDLSLKISKFLLALVAIPILILACILFIIFLIVFPPFLLSLWVPLMSFFVDGKPSHRHVPSETSSVEPSNPFTEEEEESERGDQSQLHHSNSLSVGVEKFWHCLQEMYGGFWIKIIEMVSVFLIPGLVWVLTTGLFQHQLFVPSLPLILCGLRLFFHILGRFTMGTGQGGCGLNLGALTSFSGLRRNIEFYFTLFNVSVNIFLYYYLHWQNGVAPSLSAHVRLFLLGHFVLHFLLLGWSKFYYESGFFADTHQMEASGQSKKRFLTPFLVMLVLVLYMLLISLFYYVRGHGEWETLNLDDEAFKVSSGCSEGSNVGAFFDPHDFWHFLSALTYYIIIMTLLQIDRNVATRSHRHIRVF